METGDSQKTVANADLPRRMPWSVRAASIIADSYCAIAAIAIIDIAAIAATREPGVLGFLPVVLILFGACFDLHRGHKWTLRFFCTIGAISSAIMLVFIKERNCSLPLTAYFFTLPMIVVPILLILPPSRQWWRQEGWFKLLWYLIWLFLVVGFILASGVEIMPKCASDTIVHIVRSWRCSRASSLHKLMSERPDAKRIFSHAKSSTEVFSRFIAADVAAGRTPDRLLKSALVEGVCQWCIAVDVPEDVDDDFPVVFPADIDPANLPTEWDEKGGGKEIPSEGQKMENCEDLALVVCKGGNATYRSRKSLIPRNFYNMPTGRIDRTVFYLTPHGKKALGGNLGR